MQTSGEVVCVWQMCGIGLRAAPVEWSQTWSSVYVQTLTLFPYPVHVLQKSAEGVYVADVEVTLRDLSAPPVERTQRSTYMNLQTLALFPYPVRALQTSGASVYGADMGICLRD